MFPKAESLYWSCSFFNDFVKPVILHVRIFQDKQEKMQTKLFAVNPPHVTYTCMSTDFKQY